MAFDEQVDELLDLPGVRADIAHGGEVKIEVAHRALRRLVAFFAENDLVDQTRGMNVARRDPRQRDGRQICLKPLDQRHEVPDSEDVPLHERLQALHRFDGMEHRMVCQRRVMFVDLPFEMFDLVHDMHP